jgi:HSP20 family protein
MALVKRESEGEVLLPDLFGWSWFDRFFPRMFSHFDADASMIRVEEFTEDGKLVVRAELPGVDPDEDVDVSVHDGMLDIRAERREEEKDAKKGHSEFRYGRFRRTLTLPTGTAAKDVTAAYVDGILEVRVPISKVESAGTKVPVSHAA